MGGCAQGRGPVGAGRWAVEIARSPLFDNCLTAFLDSESFELPAEMMSGLPPGECYLHVAAEVAPDRWRETSLHRFAVPLDGDT